MAAERKWWVSAAELAMAAAVTVMVDPGLSRRFRPAWWHAVMRVCRWAARLLGRAGIAAEVRYRQAVSL